MADKWKKKPTYTAYAVRNFSKDDGEEDASWLKVGVGWLHRDGKGIDVVMEAAPVSGRVVLRLNARKPFGLASEE